MAYLGRLLTDWVPQERIRSFEVRFAAITPVHAVPRLTGRVTSIDVVDGERRATHRPHRRAGRRHRDTHRRRRRRGRLT